MPQIRTGAIVQIRGVCKQLHARDNKNTESPCEEIPIPDMYVANNQER